MAATLAPGLDLQALHPTELAHVPGREDQVLSARLPGDEHVVRTDRSAAGRQLRTDGPSDSRRTNVDVEDGHRVEELLDRVALGMGLGYALDVKNLSAVNVEFYTGVDARLPVPIMLPPTPDAVDLAGLKVLIADDIADTGLTLRHVQEFCADTVADARVAVVYAKQRSVVRPDYAWKSTEAWIDFPWSANGPLVTRKR
jgi:hypothetical protein